MLKIKLRVVIRVEDVMSPLENIIVIMTRTDMSLCCPICATELISEIIDFVPPLLTMEMLSWFTTLSSMRTCCIILSYSFPEGLWLLFISNDSILRCV